MWRTELIVAAWAVAGCYHGTGVPDLDPDDPTVDDSGVGAGSTGSGEGDDGADTGEPADPDDCVDTRRYFEDEVWNPVLAPLCSACHRADGVAKESDFVLTSTVEPGFLDANYNALRGVASKPDAEGLPWVLAKVSAAVEHGGKAVAPEGSDAFEALRTMLVHFDDPMSCGSDEDIDAFFEGVELLGEVATLRKAVFHLASRHPTPAELDAVRGRGIDALDDVLVDVLHEEGFYLRIKEVANDILLTDSQKYPSFNPRYNVDYESYSNIKWWEGLPEAEQLPAEAKTSDALLNEPLNIIEWVLREELPFSEILTADYTIVNPFSGRSYSVPLDAFDDPNDEGEFIAWVLPDRPQAGILTTEGFLNTYPTTESNRNRRRARAVYEFFLATDVMEISTQAIEAADQGGDTPWLDNPDCAVCHDVIDPVASAFRNFQENADYRPKTPWHDDMHQGGLAGVALPSEDERISLQWLARSIAADRRFALSAVHIGYRVLTGQPALRRPVDPDATDFADRLRAYEVQDAGFQKIVDAYLAAGEDFRVAIKELVKGHWFRAANVDGPLSERRESELRDVGTAWLLSPEDVSRRLLATMGVAHFDDILGRYRLLYGGIDSLGATVRASESNSLIAGIAQRMANEVSCAATTPDFERSADERMLFPLVEIESADDEIRENIRYLHEHLLGESLDLDDPEIDRSVELFHAVRDDGRTQVGNGTYGASAPAECQGASDDDYTIRAWMTFVAYLLNDFRFLHD